MMATRLAAGHVQALWQAQWFWVDTVGRRVVRFAVLIFLVASASFAMIHLIPGDPVRASLGLTAPASLVAERRAELGLDQPFWLQYLHYWQGLFSGHLGVSIASREPVGLLILERLPYTATLVGITFLLVMVTSIPTGIGMAVVGRHGRRGSATLAFTLTTGFLAATPEFLLAAGLVVVFAVALKWFPVAGTSGPESYVLPVAALGLGPIAVLSRIVRFETLRVLDTDFIRLARSKRLPARTLYLRHVLPNVLTAALTLGGILLAGLVTGSILVENVFALPGLGTTIVSSVLEQDYPVVQAVILLLAVLVLTINLAVDLTLAFLDPRSAIRHS